MAWKWHRWIGFIKALVEILLISSILLACQRSYPHNAKIPFKKGRWLWKIRGGREGHINSASVWHCSDRGLFAIWTCRFSVNNLFPFPLATALLIGDVMMNRQSGVKMFLSTITLPTVLVHLIDFLIRRCYVNHLQILSAKPIQDMNVSAQIYWRWRVISANTIGVVNVHILNRQSRSNGKLVSPYWPKFVTLRLLVETMPIYKAVATGNGKNEF